MKLSEDCYFVNGSLYNRYGKLRDGLQPTEQTQKKRAKLFVELILYFLFFKSILIRKLKLFHSNICEINV